MSERQKLQLEYASYANHCAITKRVPKTWHTWKRERARPAEGAG
jgi:hypothetical protein